MSELLSGRRVLVVEDEMIILMAIEDMLAELGCKDVTAAPSVAKALALIDAQSFDVAMLDAKLGKETSEPIADALAASNIPFFFATGYRDIATSDEHKDRGVLKKPFRLVDLERSFRRVLPDETGDRESLEPAAKVPEAVSNGGRVSSPSDAESPVVEASPQGAGAQSDLGGRALRLRIRQQEILSELGVLALQGTTLKDLLDQTVRYTAEGLEAEFCKVLEYLPHQKEFVVRAGIGWHVGVVGSARFGADLESPAGFALRTSKPVISNHLENEERFRTPTLLKDHGIRRAMNVILQGEGAPFGVLEVDAVSEGAFTENDIPFLQGAANILGMAIERERREQRLNAAVERQQVLLKEINHRVKNSLQIVSALLTLQMGDGTDPELRQRLMDAASRVSAIARAHERLYKNDDIGVIELGGYLRDICSDLNLSVSGVALDVVAEEGIRVATDRAIPLVLIANELITNAVKYAYPERTDGKVQIVLARRGDGHIVLTVADDGVGMPADFDPQAGKSLGMRIVRAFAGQLSAEFSVDVRNPGSQFTLLVPLEPPA